MGWPPDDPDIWAVEARYRGKPSNKQPDIKRMRGLSYHEDWIINVVPHLQDGLMEALECHDGNGELVGWTLNARAFPAR